MMKKLSQVKHHLPIWPKWPDSSPALCQRHFLRLTHFTHSFDYFDFVKNFIVNTHMAKNDFLPKIDMFANLQKIVETTSLNPKCVMGLGK